ncbi:MAG: NADH-quinone oxidoreductase subunit L [Elusimicrobiota bacterium]
MNLNDIYVLTLPITIPLIAGLIALFLPKRTAVIPALAGSALMLPVAAMMFGKEALISVPWAGFGMDFSLRLFHFNSFILLASAFFTFLVLLFSYSYLKENPISGKFYFFLLLTTAMINGAVLSNNLILMFFFWEGLLITTYAMISLGGADSHKTAVKAFIIIGFTDLCMMLGIAAAIYASGTFTISEMHIPLTRFGTAAFVLLMIGAIAKSGAMPFHSWIPDAAIDAPMPFMSYLPAAMEKLIGIYFLTRITVDMFAITPESPVTVVMMIIGAITIVFAVMMALIQKDFKKLLSYHAISQVGYMILGIGTALPIGIIGGLFHMVNNALYKSCLFMTGGAVEKQAGTTDLKKLGGIGTKMPVTFIAFLITAAAISGVPPLNGFFSKELIYDAALERGWIFYLAAIVGSFFTAASFLKLGHAAFLGKSSEEHKNVKEAPVPMLVSMGVIALACVFFGLFKSIPIHNFFAPALAGTGEAFAIPHANIMLVLISVAVLIAALLNHIYGVRKSGKGVGASDHIHHAPVLNTIYNGTDNKYSDPYESGMKAAGWLNVLLWRVDKGIDWMYDRFTVNITYFFGHISCTLHDGNYSSYLIWSVVGTAVVLLMLLK